MTVIMTLTFFASTTANHFITRPIIISKRTVILIDNLLTKQTNKMIESLKLIEDKQHSILKLKEGELQRQTQIETRRVRRRQRVNETERKTKRYHITNKDALRGAVKGKKRERNRQKEREKERETHTERQREES